MDLHISSRWFGSDSPAGCDVNSLKAVGDVTGKGNPSNEFLEMAKILVAGNTLEDQPNRRHTSNEISAPYEVPQYPIEQIESKLNR